MRRRCELQHGDRLVAETSLLITPCRSGVRIALDRPLERLVAREEPDKGVVDHQQRRRTDEATGDRVVVADDGVLDGVGQRQQNRRGRTG